MRELEEEVLPGRVKEIEEICGAAIPYEVDWASFGDDMAALNSVDNLSCHRLNMALRMICQDEMGKEAVRNAVKKIKLKNVDTPAQRSVVLEDGVLAMHCAYALGASGMNSDSDIRVYLETKL
jgi:hypothetical protein